MQLCSIPVQGAGYSPDVLERLPRSPMLRIPQIVDRLSISVSHVYALMQSGRFPPLVHLGARARGLPEVLLDAWLWDRIEARGAMRTLHDPVVLPYWQAELVRIPPASGLRLLKRTVVQDRVARRRTALYRAIADDGFPAPVPVTSHVRRWVAHEIDAWLRDRAVHALRAAKAAGVLRFPPPAGRARAPRLCR